MLIVNDMFGFHACVNATLSMQSAVIIMTPCMYDGFLAKLFCVQPLAYMSIHLVCVILTLLLARCFWESFQAHTIFLLAILGVSVWNGAGFYFQVWSLLQYIAA